MSEPRVDKPQIPREYGNPKKRLKWSDVETMIANATVYWFASTRPDGRPHVAPRDGNWMDGGLYYGGSPETVHSRNIAANPNVVAHIGDGQEVAILEGTVTVERPSKEMIDRLIEAAFVKYPQYGRQPASLYEQGVAVLRPRKVIAWTSFTENATRFRFD